MNIDGSGNPSLSTVWKSTSGGTSPIVANGVLYYAASGHLRGLSPATGTVLWDSAQIGNVHWQSPVVANGMVYVTDQSATLSGFGGVSATTPVPALPVRDVAAMAIALLVGAMFKARRAGPAVARGARRAGGQP